MIMEIRIKVPGTASWVVTTIEAVWKDWLKTVTRFEVATQAEADILIGYSLVMGAIPIKVTDLTATSLPSGEGRALWLQLVNVSHLV